MALPKDYGLMLEFRPIHKAKRKLNGIMLGFEIMQENSMGSSFSR
jgi:hypothetical protein